MRLGRQKLDFAIRRHAVLNAAYGIAGTVGRALTRRYPLSLGPTEIDPPPFFIIGAARSGNTLLRALLVGHSHVAIPPESYVLHHIVDRWGQLAFLKWQDLVGVAIGTFASHPEFESWELDLTPVFGRAMALQRRERSLARVLDLVYRHYVDAKEPGARMWGDKTPFNTENWYAIERTFPTARYVHVLRDGRDAVSSAVQADLFSGDVSSACDSWLLRVRRKRGQADRRCSQGRLPSPPAATPQGLFRLPVRPGRPNADHEAEREERHLARLLE